MQAPTIPPFLGRVKDSATDFFGLVAAPFAVAGEVMRQALDHPSRIENLRIDPQAERRGTQRPLSRIPEHLIHKAPPMKALHFLATVDGREAHLMVVIDLDRRRIDPTRTSREILTQESHLGSAGIVGGAIVGLLSPITGRILERNARKRQACEMEVGMSWHAISFLAALGDQLPAEDRALLEEAFRNRWAHDRKMSAKTSLAGAKALLATSRLRIERCSADGLDDYDPEGDRLEERLWFNADGDLIAQCRFMTLRDGTRINQTPPDGEMTLRVLGSVFTGKDFDALYDLAAERTERIAGEGDGTDDEMS